MSSLLQRVEFSVAWCSTECSAQGPTCFSVSSPPRLPFSSQTRARESGSCRETQRNSENETDEAWDVLSDPLRRSFLCSEKLGKSSSFSGRPVRLLSPSDENPPGAEHRGSPPAPVSLWVSFRRGQRKAGGPGHSGLSQGALAPGADPGGREARRGRPWGQIGTKSFRYIN